MFLILFLCLCWVNIDAVKSISDLEILKTPRNVTVSVGKEARFTVEYRHQENADVSVFVVGNKNQLTSNNKYEIYSKKLLADPTEGILDLMIKDVSHNDEGKYSFCFQMRDDVQECVHVWLTVSKVPKPECEFFFTTATLQGNIELSCWIREKHNDTTLTWYTGKTEEQIERKKLNSSLNDLYINTTVHFAKNGTTFICEAKNENGIEICETDLLIISDQIDLIPRNEEERQNKNYIYEIIISILSVKVIVLGIVFICRHTTKCKKSKTVQNQLYIKSKRGKQKDVGLSASRNEERIGSTRMDIIEDNIMYKHISNTKISDGSNRIVDSDYTYVDNSYSIKNVEKNMQRPTKMNAVEDAQNAVKNSNIEDVTKNQLSKGSNHTVDDYLTSMHKHSHDINLRPEKHVEANMKNVEQMGQVKTKINNYDIADDYYLDVYE